VLQESMMPRSNEWAVELDRLGVDVPGFQILDDISWQLPAGAQAAILGPNGCGKSTLLRAMTAYGHVTRGVVRVLGETLGETEVHRLRRRLGIVDPVLQRLLDQDVTAEQLVATGLFGHLTTFFDRPSSDQLELARRTLCEVGLGNHARQQVVTLSSGQLCRTWLARALVHTPELLILDEPTAGLDLLGRETLLASLSALGQRRRDLTMIMVTHHLEDLLPETDHVLLLGQGRAIASGDPADVLTEANLSLAFGCPVHVERRDGRWRWSVSPRVWGRLLP
jgi:iron complex transport system ATP-binding protein